MLRIAFSCESLKVTTRLMHVIAWLLTQRAWQRGEIGADALADPKYHLGEAAATQPATIAAFPLAVRALIEESTDLYNRVARLQARMGMADAGDAVEAPSPARALIDRLQQAF
jgi:regulator of CtrA degradation